MTGRHKAVSPPSAAPRRAAVTIGLATITLPLSLPTAQASPDMNWDRVAQCESTNDWDANTGNGYSGGLQFTPSTWRAYGGTRYAPQAYQASRTEQIAIAENVLDEQGVGAWPTCGPRGLGGTTRNLDTPSSPSGTLQRPSPTPRPRTPRVPDQPRAVQRAVAASGPTNPACVSLKSRGIPVGQLDRLNAAHPELHLDGNRNGVPCDVSFPRGNASDASARRPHSAPTSRQSASSPARATAVATSQTPSSSGIVAAAQTWIGAPYRFGGTSRSGVDCSGLVQRVFAANGITLPRTAAAQMRSTTRINRAQARPGDLVGNPSGSHIGIYLGDGRMIDAPHSGSHVGVRKLYRDMTVFGRP